MTAERMIIFMNNVTITKQLLCQMIQQTEYQINTIILPIAMAGSKGAKGVCGVK